MKYGDVSLSIQDILEKEFKIDTRGYRPQEVDSFLDVIMRDYNEYNNIIKALVKDNKSLMAENHTLKEEVRNLK